MASSTFRLISKKLVKPCVSTPHTHRNYKLSLMDQLMINKYTPIAFFYPNPHHKLPNNTSQTSIPSLLEESLSKALASYYPFAGKLKEDHISIDCNDVGATFMEARIKNHIMSEILNADHNVNDQDIIYPSGLPWSILSDECQSLVVAQLTHFDCGGISISVCMNHKLGDGHTLCNFVNDWAAMTRQPSGEKPFLHFIGESILPASRDLSIDLTDLKRGQQCVTRRYVFDSKKLSELKAKAAAEAGVQKPSRVEVVSALLYKCGISASAACSGSFNQSELAFIVDLRKLIGLPVTQNYVGNFASNFSISTGDEKEVDFAKLVSEIRREKVQYYEKYKGIDMNDLRSMILAKAEKFSVVQDENYVNGYNCTSVCKFPIYDVDFGWGRPIRLSFAASPHKNFIILMDSPKVDGIEALITLEKQEMSIFQNDPELLAFASSSSS